jgi:hypothetical protein
MSEGRGDTPVGDRRMQAADLNRQTAVTICRTLAYRWDCSLGYYCTTTEWFLVSQTVSQDEEQGKHRERERESNRSFFERHFTAPHSLERTCSTLANFWESF